MSFGNTLLPGRYNPDGFSVQAATVALENGYPAHYGTSDYNTRYDRDRLVAVSRALAVNNWLYETLFNRWDDYVLGPAGFTLQAKSGSKRANDIIEQEIWPEFTEAPEVTGRLTWRDCESVNLREIGEAGDQLWLKLGRAAGPGADGKLQHIESERIAAQFAHVKNDDGGRVEQGVKLDSLGRPVGYYVADASDLGYVNPASARLVSAANAIYSGGRVKRSSSTRSLPVLTTSMPNMHRVDDILTSEAVAWQVLSRLVFTLKRGSHAVSPTFKGGKNSTTDTAQSDTTKATSNLVTDIGMALLFEARLNDEITPIDQNRASHNFEQSLKFFLRVAGAPLGMPLEAILLDWGNTNYSSARAILLQAFLSFRLWQAHLVRTWYSRVYRWQIGRAIAQGRLQWRADILAHQFNVPGWPWIDEDKEVSAWAKKLDRCISTQAQAMNTMGLDLEEQRDERKQELKDAWAAALEIEESTTGRVKAEEIWRHLSGLDTGKTESAVRASKPDPSDSPDSPDPPDSPDEGDAHATDPS